MLSASLYTDILFCFREPILMNVAAKECYLLSSSRRALIFRLKLFFCIVINLSSGQLVAANEFDSQFIATEVARAIASPDNNIEIIVAQPIGLVFDALLTRLDEYTENISDITFDNTNSQNSKKIGVGSERITTMNDGKRLVQRIIIFESPNTFVYFTDMAKSTVSVPIDYSIGHYQFSEQQDGRVNAAVSVAYKPSSRLTAFLVRLGFNRALARDFQKAEEYLNALARED